MTRAALLIAALLCAAAPARAENFRLDETPGAQIDALFSRRTFVARGEARGDGAPRAFSLTGAVWRPPHTPGAAKIAVIETTPEPAGAAGSVEEIALRRGAAVYFLPPETDAEALRALARRLRQQEGYAYVIGRGDGDSAAATIAQTASDARLFDALLLQNPPPLATTKLRRETRALVTLDSAAFWRGAPRGEETPPDAKNHRLYFLAGIAAPPTVADACAAPVNPRSAAPAHRALFAALFDWVAKGVAPPAARPPALQPARGLPFPKAPGFPAPPAVDRLVPMIDADGNESSGLRLPDLALPLGAFTAFNAPRDRKSVCAAGAFLPFAADRTQREQRGDPRPSLVERYGSRAYFVATLRVLADRLVKERMLLAEDADAYVAAGKKAPF